jgi:hypothetical protein
MKTKTSRAEWAARQARASNVVSWLEEKEERSGRNPIIPSERLVTTDRAIHERDSQPTRSQSKGYLKSFELQGSLSISVFVGSTSSWHIANIAVAESSSDMPVDCQAAGLSTGTSRFRSTSMDRVTGVSKP